MPTRLTQTSKPHKHLQIQRKPDMGLHAENEYQVVSFALERERERAVRKSIKQRGQYIFYLRHCYFTKYNVDHESFIRFAIEPSSSSAPHTSNILRERQDPSFQVSSAPAFRSLSPHFFRGHPHPGVQHGQNRLICCGTVMDEPCFENNK